MNGSFNLAIKNLTRQKRRNIILTIAIAFGFFVVTFVNSFVMGIVGNLEDNLIQLLGGSVLIQGEEIVSSGENGKSSLASVIRDDSYIKKIISECDIEYQSISYYSQALGQIIFEGKKSITNIYGRNLDEQDFLESLTFSSGGPEYFESKNPLILSKSIADSMNLEVGDEIMVTCQTIYGQNNVEDFTVVGIISSNNIFGSMNSYTDIKVLNKLLDISEAGYSTCAINLKNKKKQTNVADAIEKRIREDGVNVTSRLEAYKTKPNNIGLGLEKQLNPKNFKWEGTKYLVETFNDEIPQLQSVLFYVNIISTIVLIVILVIVMIGVSNTYKMVLLERIREIGTMRALGMRRKNVKRIFRTESVFLCLFGALIGLLFSFLLMIIVSHIKISYEPLFIFLKNGYFGFKISIANLIIQFAILIIFTIIAVGFTARKAAKLNPAVALRTIK